MNNFFDNLLIILVLFMSDIPHLAVREHDIVGSVPALI